MIQYPMINEVVSVQTGKETERGGTGQRPGEVQRGDGQVKCDRGWIGAWSALFLFALECQLTVRSRFSTKACTTEFCTEDCWVLGSITW